MIRFARSYVSLLGSDVPDVRFHASFKSYPDGKKVGEERIVALLPKNHPLATHRKVSLSQLVQEPIVTVLPCPLRLVLDAAFTKLGVKPRIVLEDQHCQYMAEYVIEGLGISIGADITWIAAGQNENVALVPIEEFNQARNLYLLKEDASHWSPASVRFADYLAEYYRERRQNLDSSYLRR